MKDSSSATPPSSASEGRPSCSGGCGGAGMCPGIALLLSFSAGYFLAAITGVDWLAPVVAIAGTLLLVAGIPQRLLRQRRS